MALKEPLTKFLFPAANILLGVLLLGVFAVASQNVVETFKVADMSALKNLQPQPADYFSVLEEQGARPDKNRIRCYVDYYKHLLHDFPNLWDAYGMLGYCYHYLNDDRTAIKYFKLGIQHYQGYFWNYYDLAAIYINESRYQEASDLLQKALTLDLKGTLKKMFTSQWVYLPLFEPDLTNGLTRAVRHLQETHQFGFVLVQILNRMGNNKEAQDMMTKIKPELYAF